MSLQYAPDQIRTLTRFSLVEEVPGLDSREVAAFATFELADDYRKQLGDCPKHIRRDIVDTQANVVRLKADASEDAELTRQIELARKRKQLLDLQEQNAARERASAIVTAPPVAPIPAPTDKE